MLDDGNDAVIDEKHMHTKYTDRNKGNLLSFVKRCEKEIRTSDEKCIMKTNKKSSLKLKAKSNSINMNPNCISFVSYSSAAPSLCDSPICNPFHVHTIVYI